MKDLVAIDLGSNSFRVLVYDCLNFKTIAEFNQVVGMADGLVETGKISQAAQDRVVQAINYSSEKLGYDPANAICVTTAAMRMANNSQEVLNYFTKETKARFSIIDGEEEARLTLLAVKYALKREKLDSNNFILLDIGGGSTEIIVNTKDKYFAKSFNFGIVTLTQKHSNHDTLIQDLEKKKIDITNFLNEINIDIEKFNFVATAGTPTTIAAIKLGQDFFHYDKDQVNGTKVKIKDLQDCLDIFNNSNENEILKLVGKGRVEFIEVGVYIYKAIFEVLNKKESIVLDDGLREGVAINQCLLR
ncbi:exopolyphosphatase [Arcobacter sp. CECT 8985]|uniref:Ppx/GppA phosphatase family protein n=1 Tax=Arcobacter sp. CECT 8985 TaxID=1935424 RepID=UPI00100A83EC|nr:exopolyphosphatase [Arcobacter sp. CECT 8985]RXJ86445.1 exopolyphosphatase [Arcobacter sp. CECT 8985]